MRQLFVFDTTTGGNAFSVPFVKGSLSWTESRNRPNQIKFKVPGYDESLKTVSLFDLLQPLRRSVAVVEDGVVRAAGLITRHPTYSTARKSLSISAVGPEYIFKNRLLLRESHLRGGWTTVIQNDKGEDESIPNPAVRMSFENQSWPTMISNLIRTILEWDGGALPIVFPPAGTGSHTRYFDPIEAKTVGEIIDDIRDLEGGPEVQIEPTMYGDEFRYLLRVGDDAEPRVKTSTELVFSEKGNQPSIRDLDIDTDSKGMGSRAWFISGDVDDFHLSTYDNFNLLDKGFPLLDIIDDSRSNVTEQLTLDSYSREALRVGQKFSRFFSFDVNIASPKHKIADIRLGDFCILETKGDNYLPKGRFRLRIAEISYDGGMWAKVTTDGIEIV